MNNLFICNHFLQPIKFQIKIASPSSQQRGRQSKGQERMWLLLVSAQGSRTRVVILTELLDLQPLSWELC